LPPDQPPAAAQTFSMPVQLGKVAGMEQRDPVPAAPHIRRLAREIGVDIHSVQGSGPGGRISEDDVKLSAKNALSTMAAAAAAAQTPRGSFVEPSFRISGSGERLSACRSAECGAKPPSIFVSLEHDSACHSAGSRGHHRARQLRASSRRGPKKRRQDDCDGDRVEGVCVGVESFSAVNASIDMAKEEIVYKQYINIGVAVDTDRGLLVPVIRDVDKKNIVELAAELTQLSKKQKSAS